MLSQPPQFEPKKEELKAEERLIKEWRKRYIPDLKHKTQH